MFVEYMSKTVLTLKQRKMEMKMLYFGQNVK